MWYKKKRFIASIVTVALLALGGIFGVDLMPVGDTVTDAVCNAVSCM